MLRVWKWVWGVGVAVSAFLQVQCAPACISWAGCFSPPNFWVKTTHMVGGGGGGGVYVQSGEGRKLPCGVPLPPQTFTCNAAHHLHAAWLFFVPYDVCLSLCM